MTQQTSMKWTYEDYLLLPNDGRRHEIVDGEHYVNPAPNMKHQLVLSNLHRILSTFIHEHALGVVVFAPTDVVLSDIDVVEPDILFVSNARRSIVTRANIKGAPDLVVEALSEFNRRHDEITKRRLYETYGVSEYWIVDPELDVIKIHRHSGSSLERVVELDCERGGTITTPLLPGFALDVRDVFTFE